MKQTLIKKTLVKYALEKHGIVFKQSVEKVQLISLQLIFVMGIAFFSPNVFAFSFLDELSKELDKSLNPNPPPERRTYRERRVEPTHRPVRKPPPRVETKYGVTVKNANMRGGPGTNHRKVGRIPKGTEITILESKGKWYQVEASSPEGMKQGWVYAPLISIENVVYTSTRTNRSRNKQYPQDRSNLEYAGYSEDFQVVKHAMLSGDLNAVEDFYAEREREIREKSQSDWELIENIGLLRWMERGTLALDSGNLDESIRDYSRAEDILNVRQQDSQAEDFLSSITSFAAETITGNEEFQEYPGEGYEKVLMLNYKSIAYLLDGKRKAYNVTRRAIDWQNREKQIFEDELREVQEKEASQGTQQSQSEWQESYRALDAIAERVPSAYVNPFGFYVAGMIQEFESKEDRSLRDNARISYQKALALNPESKVLKQAVKDMKKKAPKDNKRLVHVVVADGFVPEKKMLVYRIPTDKGVVPIKLSIYEPTPSSVARIEVQTPSGKRLAKLSPVADVEAICLRDQKDKEAFRSLRVGIAIARSVGINDATSRLGVFGAVLGGAVNEMAAPDMRSWMSLPATIQAARLRVSNNIKQLKIVTYGVDGRRLGSTLVNLNKRKDNFVYARSLEKQLYAIDAKPLWL